MDDREYISPYGTTVVNINARGRGSYLGAEYDVYIGRCQGRRGMWGNPFIIGRDGSREAVVAKYARWIVEQPRLMNRLYQLRGRRLGCWCAPALCHGDVLMRLADSQWGEIPSSGVVVTQDFWQGYLERLERRAAHGSEYTLSGE